VDTLWSQAKRYADTVSLGFVGDSGYASDVRGWNDRCKACLIWRVASFYREVGARDEWLKRMNDTYTARSCQCDSAGSSIRNGSNWDVQSCYADAKSNICLKATLRKVCSKNTVRTPQFYPPPVFVKKIKPEFFKFRLCRRSCAPDRATDVRRCPVKGGGVHRLGSRGAAPPVLHPPDMRTRAAALLWARLLRTRGIG
jgi:hypothetical protein